jgi:glycosyltransferase involved in cell wall biosynthesis
LRQLRLVQIVPELPPAVGGVGDYASLLAKELSRLGIRTTFVIPDRQRQAQPERPPDLPEASPVWPRPDALAQRLDALRPDAVLLHYSGYGYAKRGAPVWLVQGLRRWKARAPGRRLVAMFHELWAHGPPWRSSCWMFPVQRAIVAALLRLADAHLTNTELYARRLRRLAPHRSPVAVLPVLSNIGEPSDLPPLEAREPLAVVFGQPGMRARVYRHFEAFLPALHAAGIEAILDIGPPLAGHATDEPALPVTRCGYLDAAPASAMMLRARVGLLDRPLDFAAKSGIFAAYAAHGLIPVIRTLPVDGEPDRLRHGVNVLRTDRQLGPELRTMPQRLATAINLWYRDHAAAPTGAVFAYALDSGGGTRCPPLSACCRSIWLRWCSDR